MTPTLGASPGRRTDRRPSRPGRSARPEARREPPRLVIASANPLSGACSAAGSATRPAGASGASDAARPSGVDVSAVATSGVDRATTTGSSPSGIGGTTPRRSGRRRHRRQRTLHRQRGLRRSRRRPDRGRSRRAAKQSLFQEPAPAVRPDCSSRAAIQDSAAPARRPAALAVPSRPSADPSNRSTPRCAAPAEPPEPRAEPAPEDPSRSDGRTAARARPGRRPGHRSTDRPDGTAEPRSSDR